MRNVLDNATYKENIHSARYAVFGKSYIYITCGWCGAETKAYVWSLAGGGKKCDECPAVHNSIGLAELKDVDFKKFKDQQNET